MVLALGRTAELESLGCTVWATSNRVDFLGRTHRYRVLMRAVERASVAFSRVHQGVRRTSVTVEEDVAYTPSAHPSQRLEILRASTAQARRGAVVYVHGGAFQYLSRRTHRHMAMVFALEGWTVFNLDYRLAPMHPYPACLEDVAAGLSWIAAHADALGVDPNRLIIAGESAGAHIAVSMAIAQAMDVDTTWARRVRQAPLRLRGCIAACGVFGVPDPNWRQPSPKISSSTRRIFEQMARRYVRPWNFSSSRWRYPDDPVKFLEQRSNCVAPLPELFAFVGGKDPVEEDTHRLVAAYTAAGGRAEKRVFSGEIHAFHAISLRAPSRAAWRAQTDFISRCLDEKETEQCP